MSDTPSWSHGWQLLGQHPTSGLPAPRRQLHRAARIAASVGKALLPPQPDDSHQAFHWLTGARLMAQEAVHGSQPFRAALRPEDLELVLLSEDDAHLVELPLSGRSVDDTYRWLEQEVRGFLGRPLPAKLEHPGEIDGEQTQGTDRFSRHPPAAFAELGRWFANAHLLLHHRVEPLEGAGPVRIWPHHFDIASLITVEAGDDPEQVRTVGIGMTPGDGGEPEPYFYVTPWPRPEQPGTLPDLPAGGRWQHEGWFGALLPAAELAASSDPVAQAEAAAAFVTLAVDTCRDLVSS